MGAFGSLVCEVWKRGGLEPHRGQGMVEGRQEREWFRMTNGGIGSERNRVRVPVF